VHWQPPAQDPNPPDQHSSPSERRLAVLEHGEAWLRPPQRNAWGSTHAVTIADGSGAPLAEFSRRYPQPWPGSCPFPQPAPQPRPPGDPQWIEATVIALVGLSAETYYHWLVEILPTLGWLATHHPQWLGPEVRIWHNGGAADYVPQTLHQACGIDPAQLLDARSLPWIRARRLVAVSPAPFGCPSAAGQLWLRQTLLGQGKFKEEPSPPRRIWLRRGASARRPVFGEQETLERLRAQGVVPLDCADLTVPEQARRLAEASLVITPHGGAMANLVFTTAGTTVLELHHPHYQPPYYQHLAQHRQLIYFSQSQHERPPALYRDLLFESPATEPIVLNPERVAEAVRSLL
jgi:capsular polysaccharide biosynthesis protein